MMTPDEQQQLYLRVNVLLTQLKDCAYDHNSGEGNLLFYSYLINIQHHILTFEKNINELIKTEKHILSENFLNQISLKDKDKKYMKAIIRQYKLKLLL